MSPREVMASHTSAELEHWRAFFKARAVEAQRQSDAQKNQATVQKGFKGRRH